MEYFQQQMLHGTLAEAVGGALSRYDDLAEEIFHLEEALRSHQSLGDFVARCRGLGLPLAALEDKLAARAAALAEADREYRRP